MIESLIKKSAKSALFSWSQNEDGLEDLVNDLWVWYLESPATQKKLSEVDDALAKRFVYKAALQILAKKSLTLDRFAGKNLFSSDSVREALSGTSRNKYLIDILPRALRSLEKNNSGHAEAIRLRYIDGVVPSKSEGAHMLLSRAVKSLTEHVNIIAITAGVDANGNVKDGPGSRSAVFPETRRPKGHGHSDPTGDIAMLLIEHPELRDEYLKEESLEEFLGGRGYAQLD